jgi:PAS domain S-box-containing protein
MVVHPGQENRRAFGAALIALDPIQRALQENEDWYQDLVEHSHDLLCIHDLAGRLLSVNPAPARLLGYSVEEILQIPMREMLAPECRSAFDVYLEEIQRVGDSRGFLQVMTRSGERRIWEYHNTLRTEGVASPIVRGMAHDVTEQKEAGRLLLDANERLLSIVRENESTIEELKLFRTLVDQSNDAIEVVEPETLRFLDVNGKACSALGYSREELLSMRVFDINPAVTEISSAAVIQELRKSGFKVLESAHRRKDGSTFPVEVSLRRVQLEREYLVAIARDLTERKLVEEALRNSEARERAKSKELEAVLDAVPVPVFLARDADCKYVSTNRIGYEQLRLPRGANISKSALSGKDLGFRVLRDGIEVPAEELPMQRVAATASPVYDAAYSLIFEDGTVRHELFNAVPLTGENGRPAGVVGASMDVTVSRRAEEDLKRSESRYRALHDRAPVGICRVDTLGHRFLEVNSAFCGIVGRTERELLERDIESITHPDDLEDSVGKLRQLAAGESRHYSIEKRYLRPDGSVRWVQAEIVAMWAENSSPTWHMAIVHDITERRLAEKALQTSERLQHEAAEQLKIERARLIEAQAVAKVGSWEAELPSLDITWSEQTHRIFETDPIHFHPRRPDFVGFIHPEDRARVDAAFEASLDNDGPCSVEYRIVMADGRIKVLEEQWKVFRDEQGRAMRLMGTCRDVTDQKRAQEDLRRSEESYRMFVSQSSEGIFREAMDEPLAIDLPEEELVHRILHNAYIAECNDALAAMYGCKSGEELRGKYWRELAPTDDPRNVELTRQFVRSGFRVLDHESHEMDVHGNPKIFLNSMIGVVENGKLVRTWGIQREITETAKLEESRRKAEEALRQNVAELQQVTEELRLAKEKLAEEKIYLEEAIDTELGFGEIIGRSGALKQVMAKVAMVAPSDATVLLLGETGTGKELVARALHRMSQRNGKSFIKLNCAAIPSGLLESELFGHEKGAFTGAVARKLGRLELADKGTLFLDEIGEIPLSLQPKLLRVLQDMEFERLGSTQTLRVNFRLLAATNRDLLQSIKAREFRSDLYYRLNVFPIYLPPLRERREDIRALVEHFVRKFATRMRRSITSIPAKTMEDLVRWDWPGNIRELENFIERSVILTPGSVLQSPLSELQTALNPGDDSDVSFADDRERILRALRECHGQLGGPDGAAARLGLKRTTLQSKLDQLGIKPGTYRS